MFKKKTGRKVVPQYLLLGASGVLGGAVYREFIAQGIECLYKTREALDVTDYAEVRRQVMLLKPELVINATGFTDVYTAEEEAGRQRCWKVNVGAVDNLVKLCAREDVPLIQFSDSRVFGDALGNTPRQESDPLCPMGNYAQSRACGEIAVLGASQMVCPEFWNRGFRYWLIRTSYLFSSVDSKRRNEMTMNLDLATRRGGYAAPIPSDVYRSITYAPHLAKVVVWLARHHREVVSGVYHVCNAGYGSLYGYYSKLARDVGRGRLQFRAEPAAEIARATGVNHRITTRYAGLVCDKWYEIAPFEIPTAEDALAEFARCLG